MPEITIETGNGLFDMGYIVPLPDAYVKATNDNPSLVVDIPFDMPMKPEHFPNFLASIEQKAADVVRGLESYDDQNVAGAMLHLIGNMRSGLIGAELLAKPDDLTEEDIRRFKLLYVRSAVGLGNACEIAWNLLSGKQDGFSAKELLNFARYDAFCKRPTTTTDFCINGVNVDDYDGELKLETPLLVHIFELIHNSSKADATHIHADLNIYSGGVTFLIDDNGHGIPADHILDIFAKNYSTRPENEKQLGRGGLGLYFLAQFAAARRGMVFVQSFEADSSQGVRCEAVEGKPELICRDPEFTSVNTRMMISIPGIMPKATSRT